MSCREDKDKAQARDQAHHPGQGRKQNISPAHFSRPPSFLFSLMVFGSPGFAFQFPADCFYSTVPPDGFA
jgi:hypothetical protein